LFAPFFSSFSFLILYSLSNKSAHVVPQALQQLPKTHAYTRGSLLYLQASQTRTPPPCSAEWQHPCVLSQPALYFCNMSLGMLTRLSTLHTRTRW
jgi:hypothetical protein